MSDDGKSGDGKPPGGEGSTGRGRPRRRGGRARRRRGRGRGVDAKPEEQGQRESEQGSRGAEKPAPAKESSSADSPTGTGRSSGERRRRRSSRRRRGQRPESHTDAESGARQKDSIRTSGQRAPDDDRPLPDYESLPEEQLTYLKPHVIDEDVFLNDLSEYDFPDGAVLMDVVGVKLHASGRVSQYDCQNMHLEQGDVVIVETGRGLALGEVVIPASRRLTTEAKLSRVIRKATQHDIRQRDRNLYKEQEAYSICLERIDTLRLPMKLIRVDYLHGGNKAVFYFCAEGRIDFRELVRDLARRLHIRVEMRQIGVRDASRMQGGIGSCGLRLCCNRYIREFAPVSIRMAKDQDLVLNPEKVSGICGRLMCCLAYEDEVYREAARDMPRVGRRVSTPAGVGRIKDRDVLKRVVRVQLADEPGLHEFSIDQIGKSGEHNDPAGDDAG